MTLDVDQLQIGNDAAWLLSFHRQVPDASGFLTVVDDPPVLEIGSDDYYAQINASLPGGLEGGVYSFVIEGLTDAHYRVLKAESRLVVKLFLYWKDTNAGVAGFLSDIAGLAASTVRVHARDIPDALVAVLSVVSISRRAGSRLYETTITARERVFEILNSRRVCGTTIEAPPEDAVARLLLGRVKLKEFQFHGASPHPVAKYLPAVEGTQNDGRLNLRPGGPALQLLRDIGSRLEQKTGRYGRGMFLLRDGVLHIGTRSIPFRPVPPTSAPPPEIDRSKALNPGNGLIEFQALEAIATDPNFDACNSGSTASFTEEGSALRRQFQLTLKGRPDIKPGDVALFDLPTEENGDEEAGVGALSNQLTSGVFADPSVLGGSSGRTVQLYVSTVDHRLGRTSGFVTTIAGVEFVDEADQWDGHTPASERTPAFKSSSEVTPETSAGKAVQRLVKSHVDAMRFAEVCEVRRATTQGHAEPPSQSVDLLCGLEPGDGHANQARRLAINRKDADLASGVPYATPFAWGKCGLVLPRYPGTRLVTVNRQGRAEDPIDVGALWESGHGPDSQPGDWWLILPVGIPQERRQEVGANDIPLEHQGQVTQDLIDADGNRAIEVGQLTILVLPQGQLRNAGERPQHGQHVTGGASIIMKPDGSITIKGERIEFDAGDGDITMKAKKVNVKVEDSMDVS